MMMIVGFAVTASTAGRYLDPYSGSRLVAVTATVVGIALLIMLVALHGLERGAGPDQRRPDDSRTKFSEALRQVWAEAEARQFTIFVFISMLAYSAQDLILEPFAGTVFGFSVGESTSLSGLQHQGVFAGMITVAVVTSAASRAWFGSLKLWTVAGCLGSALTLGLLSMASLKAPAWPLAATVFALGFANGAFAVAAIGSMMANAGHGTRAREGVRMGLWGAAQASAFGIGGFAGTVMSDVAHTLLGSPVQAYAVVFGLEGALFLISAILAAQLRVHRSSRSPATRCPVLT
jgi:BCD family chlorophyll transporter-like MFS transporter